MKKIIFRYNDGDLSVTICNGTFSFRNGDNTSSAWIYAPSAFQFACGDVLVASKDDKVSIYDFVSRGASFPVLTICLGAKTFIQYADSKPQIALPPKSIHEMPKRFERFSLDLVGTNCLEVTLHE